jgi:hypothetical protein
VQVAAFGPSRAAPQIQILSSTRGKIRLSVAANNVLAISTLP